jgi:hypothetical protein
MTCIHFDWLARALVWASTPTLTDWLNVLIVFALLSVTRRYAGSTALILKANQDMLETTKGILAETASQAAAASQNSSLALHQWRESQLSRLVPIHVALNDAERAIERFERHLRRALNDGSVGENLASHWRSPASISDAVERARHISLQLHAALVEVQRCLRDVDAHVDTLVASNGGDFDSVKGASVALVESHRCVRDAGLLASSCGEALSKGIPVDSRASDA